MDAILQKAIKRISIVTNTSTGLAHPLDESRAKDLFKAFHKAGVILDYEKIRSLAIQIIDLNSTLLSLQI